MEITLLYMEKSWNCVLESCGNPEGTGPFLYQKLNKSKIHFLIDTYIPSIKCKNIGFQGSEEPNAETIETIQQTAQVNNLEKRILQK